MQKHEERARAVLLATIPKAQDLEIHVRRLYIDGIEVVELRDFIPSLEEYGRGYWIPATEGAILSVIEGLNEAR